MIKLMKKPSNELRFIYLCFKMFFNVGRGTGVIIDLAKSKGGAHGPECSKLN